MQDNGASDLNLIIALHHRSAYVDASININNIRDNSDPRLDPRADYDVAAACFEGSSQWHVMVHEVKQQP